MVWILLSPNLTLFVPLLQIYIYLLSHFLFINNANLRNLCPSTRFMLT